MVGPRRFRIGPWHAHVWQTDANLQSAFPDLAGTDAPRFRNWLDTDAHALRMFDELKMPSMALGPDGAVDGGEGKSAKPERTRPYGWNVVGYFSAELGVGEAGRLVDLSAEAAGIATQLVAVVAARSRNQHKLHRALGEELFFDNSLYCVNADELLRTMSALGDPIRSGLPDHRRGRRIGLWFWEVDTFPAKWAPIADQLDDIWSASEYSAAAISSACSRPVDVIRIPICPPTRGTPFSRQQVGLPDGFVFLFSYDFNSVMQRKNPLGLIEAYTRAFGPDDGATLVLKSINGSSHLDQLDRVRHAARRRPDILILDGYVDVARMQAMIELSDAFVSLHRSEGFGLHLAAAMACGRPVIATGYSGNLSFMDPDSAFLVPYELVPVGSGFDPYPETANWAEPDLDAAAALMGACLCRRGRRPTGRRSGSAAGDGTARIVRGQPTNRLPADG